MTDGNDTEKKTLTLARAGARPGGGGGAHVKQQFSHGRNVTVEVAKRRSLPTGGASETRPAAGASSAPSAPRAIASSTAFTPRPERPTGLGQPTVRPAAAPPREETSSARTTARPANTNPVDRTIGTTSAPNRAERPAGLGQPSLRPPSNAPRPERPATDRPAGDRTGSYRNERPNVDRPGRDGTPQNQYGDRTPRTTVPQSPGPRPAGERPAYGDRNRPAGDRPGGDRPRHEGGTADRNRSDRPAYPPRPGAPRTGEARTATGTGGPALSTAQREARQRALQNTGSAADGAQRFGAMRSQIGQRSFARPELAATTPDDERRKIADRAGASAAAKLESFRAKDGSDDSSDARKSAAAKMAQPAKKTTGPTTIDRRTGRLTVTQALDDNFGSGKTMSDAARRRLVMKQKRKGVSNDVREKIMRDVTVPDTITVQELSNRMSEPGGLVIKTLMKMGVMATINQVIDADTAELIASELGHRVVRVSESDVELGLGEWDHTNDTLVARPPVVTIMGHVDHGKTSLLDAIRATDVVSGEAGGITQHIGAYQVTLKSGQKITFLDTPGHAAFTEMRARGANVTDVVVLVVAADDSVMPQTVEALNHARAAGVPIVVAINKVDKPGANPQKIKTDLLQYNIQTEDLGGETQAVEVSAKQKLNLDKLEEAILLQAEILDLKANPNRPAVCTVVESKQQVGRGAVATVLVQDGTLRTGDIFVTGSEWGRVRALHNDHGKTIKEAAPGQPVEVVGLTGIPNAGDDFIVVENESKAREITEFRQRKKRDLLNLASKKASSLEQMFNDIQTGAKKELTVIIKGDVNGSVEAIAGSLAKAAGESTEVGVRVLHTGVGAINESDITLANASKALVIAFNVRPNPQARDLAKLDGIDIRYYSVIYDIIDDVKQMLTGMLAPTVREQFLGNAAIREVFNITKVGKVAGCIISDGLVKRGAKVRLLRDGIVIHDGTLKTLKRFKEEVKEVKEGYECGMAFEGYEDIRVGDTIECYELESIARAL